MKDNKDNQQGALELVVLRNAFYRDSYRRAVMGVLLLLVLNVLLGATIVYKYMTPPKPQYFATTADGKLINWHPLSDPVWSDSYVLQWTANSVRAAFSLDFKHWRQQLQTASSAFTPLGWKYFLGSLKQSNNLATLTGLKMVSNAQLTGAPEIVEKEVLGKRYAWKIRMPILVTYTNGTKTIPMAMDVTVIVLRVPISMSPARIAINNFLPIATKAGAS